MHSTGGDAKFLHSIGWRLHDLRTPIFSPTTSVQHSCRDSISIVRSRRRRSSMFRGHRLPLDSFPEYAAQVERAAELAGKALSAVP